MALSPRGLNCAGSDAAPGRSAGRDGTRMLFVRRAECVRAGLHSCQGRLGGRVAVPPTVRCPVLAQRHELGHRTVEAAHCRPLLSQLARTHSVRGRTNEVRSPFFNENTLYFVHYLRK